MIFNTFINKIINIFKKIKEKFVILTRGEDNFNYMMYAWGVIPGVLITIFFQNKIVILNTKFLQVIIYLFLICYFTWHFFVVRKTLKVQPQYKVVKPSKKELYEGKSKEQIEQIKKEKRKERWQKLLLLRAWDSTPAYVLVECFDIYLILTQIQGLFNVFKFN